MCKKQDKEERDNETPPIRCLLKDVVDEFLIYDLVDHAPPNLLRSMGG